MALIKQVSTILIVLVAAALTACGSLSHNIAADGSGAEKLIWPAPEDVTPIHKDGTWPTPASVRQVHPGMTKNQIMKLIAEPHFHEGAWGVHEWDYLFHLRDPQTGQAQLCQYKILFDRDMRAGSIYWKPQSCAALITVARPETIVLPVSALFAFDRSAFRFIKAEGQTRLYQLAGRLKDRVANGATIEVHGYTDPIGTPAYNRALSQQRAETVRAYLVDQGVPADAITAQGHGEASPVAECEDAAAGERIACLAPDRRVEVVIQPGT